MEEKKRYNEVTCFMWYVFNKWTRDEAVLVFGSLGDHIFSSGCIVVSTISETFTGIASWMTLAGRSWLTGRMKSIMDETMAETLLKEADGIKLSVETIKDIKLLGHALVRFADTCITQCCVLRSEDMRIPAIRDKGIMNPNAVFSKESYDAMEKIVGDANQVSIALGRFDMGFGISNREVAELVRFCLKHQLKKEKGWDCELTDEEHFGLETK